MDETSRTAEAVMLTVALCLALLAGAAMAARAIRDRVLPALAGGLWPPETTRACPALAGPGWRMR